MWYLINRWKLLSENPQAHPEKIHSPPQKIEKVQIPLFANIEHFSATPPSPPPCRKGEGEDTGRGINFWFQ